MWTEYLVPSDHHLQLISATCTADMLPLSSRLRFAAISGYAHEPFKRKPFPSVMPIKAKAWADGDVHPGSVGLPLFVGSLRLVMCM